jgi:hypothetical protein
MGGEGDAPVKKLVLVLTTFLVTRADADTVTIGWGINPSGVRAARCLPHLARSLRPAPIVDVIAHLHYKRRGRRSSTDISILVHRRLRATGRRQTFASMRRGKARPRRQLDHLPSRFATDEMPPGSNGFTVAEQIFICGGADCSATPMSLAAAR